MDEEDAKNLQAAACHGHAPPLNQPKDLPTAIGTSTLSNLDASLSDDSGVPAGHVSERGPPPVAEPREPPGELQQQQQAEQAEQAEQPKQADSVGDYLFPSGELNSVDAEEVLEALKNSVGQSALEAILKEIELESRTKEVYTAPALEWEISQNNAAHNEASLAELQKTIEQLSQPATRANSLPPSSSAEQTPEPAARYSTSALSSNAGETMQTTFYGADVNAIDFSKIPQDIPSLTNWLTEQVNKARPITTVAACGSLNAQGNVFEGGNRAGRRKSSAAADPNEADKSRIREENRERKKRWREVNQDRNKDNDLRCRVTKRAQKIFGTYSSPEKTEWMVAEFQKRKEKRMTKEKARDGGDNGMHASAGSSSVFPAYQPAGAIHSSGIVPNRSQATFYNPQPTQDANRNQLLNQQLGQQVMATLSQLSQNPALLNQLQTLLAASSEAVVAASASATQPAIGAKANAGPTPMAPNAETGGEDGWNIEDPQMDLRNFEDLGLEGINVDNIGMGAIDDLVASVEEAMQVPNNNNPNFFGNSNPPTAYATASNTRTSGEITPSVEPAETNQEFRRASEDVSIPSHNQSSYNGNGNVLSHEEILSPDLHSSTAETSGLVSVVRGIFGPNVEVDKLIKVNTNGELYFEEDELLRLCVEGNIDLGPVLEGLLLEASAECSYASTRDPSPSATNSSAGAPVDRLGNVRPNIAQPQQPDPLVLDLMTGIEFGDAQNMTLEQIDELIGELTSVTGTYINDEAEAHPPAPAAAQPPNIPVTSSVHETPYASITQPPAFANTEYAQLYTPENMAAIISALISTDPSPPPQPPAVPSPPPFRNNKRPATTYYSPTPKRSRASPPNAANGMNTTTAAAANQFNVFLESSSFAPITHFHSHPPANHMNSHSKDAYTASFGNSDAMNKRLMKPPPYRPGGVGFGTMGNAPGGVGIATRKRSGEDEKKIRAMGFPPLMAGMKRV